MTPPLDLHQLYTALQSAPEPVGTSTFSETPTLDDYMAAYPSALFTSVIELIPGDPASDLICYVQDDNKNTLFICLEWVSHEARPDRDPGDTQYDVYAYGFFTHARTHMHTHPYEEGYDNYEEPKKAIKFLEVLKPFVLM